MAVAVSGCNCLFSVISPTSRFRYSASSKSCLASSRRSTGNIAQSAIHHKRRTTGQNRGSTSSKRKNGQKEATIQKNYTGRSKDEIPYAYADGNIGSQSSTVYGSFGLQREDKDLSFDLKEQQVKPSTNRESDFLNAIVKVYCTHKEPDYSLPWQKKRQYTSTGSAFMIEGRKLLTNSHCVEYHTQVQVKRRGDDTKYVAKVLSRGVDCDLALLSVENEEFWRDVDPLRFGETPHLQDAVTVVGYPLGGETISVTKGVVSRIEVTLYSHGSSDLLGIQIDAAINPGNSGGPVFNDRGECIGVAFQVHGSEEAENIGYVIPTVVVSHFLTDYKKNGRYTGFPTLGVLVQNLDNPTIRACFKVRSNEGVLVRRVDPTSDANNVLKEGDVIVSFDDVRVSCEGTIPFRYDEDVGFHYLITEKFAGDTAEVCFIRAGRLMKEKVVLNPRVHLVPFHLDGRQPSYLIIGGLVFTPLSEPLIEEEDEDSIGLTLLTKARYSLPAFRGQQIVILSQVLANEVNIGYEDMSNEQVVKFNGTLIKNIHHLAHLIDSCRDKYLIFEFDSTYLVVLEREAAGAAASCILRDYGIPSERSSGLFEQYVDPVVDNQATMHEFGDTPASNCEIDYDGLRWV